MSLSATRDIMATPQQMNASDSLFILGGLGGGINVVHDGRLPPTYPPYTTKDPLTSMS